MALLAIIWQTDGFETYLEDPKGNNAISHELLGSPLQMEPYTSKCDSRGRNVEMQKGLVECMSHR
jgi:hypothetical protein